MHPTSSISTSRTRTILLALIATAFLTIVLAQSALAASVTGASGGPFTLTAGTSEANNISVTKYNSTTVQIADSGSTLTESSGSCSKSGANVRCTVSSGGTTDFIWNLADGNDTITFASDVLLDNTIDGNNGDDSITGSSRRDLIKGGLGTDVVNCGGGIDEMSYADHTVGVYVYPDGLADDGDQGLSENDNVATDCEDIVGGGGSGNYIKASDSQAGILFGGNGVDTLVASSGNTESTCSWYSASKLWGYGGDDLLVGVTGANTILGGDGNDTSLGGTGCDSIYDEFGSDVLIGNAGNDWLMEGYQSAGSSYNVLIGGPGQDDIDGYNHDDLIVSVDGESDTVSCGAGTDEVVRDDVDTGADCETATVVSTYY